MNLPEAASAAPSPRPRSRLRFELIFASTWLAVGLFVLPALIFWVGAALLGPYAESGGSIGRFYADFFADLGEPSGRAWTLTLGPLVLVSLIRLIFVGLPERKVDGTDADHAAQQEKKTAGHTRVEPRIGSD